MLGHALELFLTKFWLSPLSIELRSNFIASLNLMAHLEMKTEEQVFITVCANFKLELRPHLHRTCNSATIVLPAMLSYTLECMLLHSKKVKVDISQTKTTTSLYTFFNSDLVYNYASIKDWANENISKVLFLYNKYIF